MRQAGSDTPTWPGTASANTQPANQPAYYPPAYPPAQPAQPVQAGRAARPGYVASQPPAGPYTPGPSPSSRLLRASARAIALVLAIVEALLMIRIVLLLLAASPTAAFSNFIYGWTDLLVAPFQGVFPSVSLTSGHVFDVTALLALIVYAIAARLLERVVRTLERV